MFNHLHPMHSQLRVAALPVYAGLAALAAATALLSRALAAAGCPPDGYVDGAKVR